jgi:diguanylate cyclase (GGDEF)-like protein
MCALRKGGYEIKQLVIDNRQDLLSALHSNVWDVVLTDHNMKGFDSEQVITTVRAKDEDIPIIIVSGSIGEDIAVAAMKAGANDYIMKGSLARLVPAIEREIREAATRRAHRHAQARIQHMAYHDALTGLANRVEFENRLDIVLQSARDQGLSHALLYLDLDQFKVINDTCGHMAGDELLRQVASLLLRRIRSGDVLSRLGGDEFGVLLEACQSDRAKEIAEALRNEITEFRFVWRDKQFNLGVSIGVVYIDKYSTTRDEVLAKADMACYAAKDLGRNRIHVFSDTDKDLAQRHSEMHWISQVDEALNNSRFLLYSQPIISLGQPGANSPKCEVLLRFRDENNEIIFPDKFIPAAERYNVMPAVDRWVIDNIMSYMANYGQDKNNQGIYFINLSGTSLNDQELFDYVHSCLSRYRIRPDNICFEITETAAISNLNKTIEFIDKIKGEGCHFALDDFGAGLSSFSYFNALPLAYLKIDGGFVQDMLTDDMDCAIVEAVNQVGHVAGIETIAEFVENEATRIKLQQIGVDYAQGFALAPPVPLDL